VNLVAHESQLSVNGDLATFEDRFCGSCGSPIYSALVGTDGIIAVKAGTLDDKADVLPTVEAWCDHKQPWVDLPGMAVSMDRE